MPDIIQLLPDSVANQIAAGEVIQRPASAIKELLENAIDAGADNIKLFIKDAGKALIHVIDNGCGMSETDARMSFERHATSKIRQATDLFSIQTLGFRGEALASMAAIAQLEVKTKRVEDEAGTQIQIEGSQVISQIPCACPDGTVFTIKNLFYNIPARRKFLKSNTTELRHILEEFHRVALARPEIQFTLTNDNRQLFNLAKSNFKQRIVALFGSSYNNKLVPLKQESDVVTISGFIGKPEFARKTRGEQYFFVNNRFIKHPYLHHAVDNAFKELIPNESYPTYFIFLKVKTDEIDINIHPTKTEVNFQNNQVIYAMLSSTIKQALGKFNITPSLDFESEPPGFDIVPGNTPIKQPQVKINPDFNPFEQNKSTSTGYASPRAFSKPKQDWEKLYDIENIKGVASRFEREQDLGFTSQEESQGSVVQMHENYIFTSVKSGVMVIHRQHAQERILFEKFIARIEKGQSNTQQLLFPIALNITAENLEILLGLKEQVKKLGFDIEQLGQNSISINGAPAELNNADIHDVLDSIIENVKKEVKGAQADHNLAMAQTLAAKMAFRQKSKLETEEIKSLIDSLFACKTPTVSPDGKAIVRIISLEELEQKFRN